MVSDLFLGEEKTEVKDLSRILLVRSGGKWMASVATGGEKAYTVTHDTDPAIALFLALRHKGLVDPDALGNWRHPNPFIRLMQAIDRNIIARMQHDIGEDLDDL